MRFLPRLEEVPGWRFENEPLVIPPNRLAERIGIDAQHFLAYGVIDVTIGEYRRIDGRGFATVEIFRFPDFIKAFGAYSTRRTRTSVPLPIENEAYKGPRSVHVWRGPFYVRVIGGGNPEVQQALVDLALGSVTEMPPAPSRPAVFKFLPDERRIPNSETFDVEQAFGQPGLRNAFTARFNVNGKEVEGLVLPAASRQAAANVLNYYRNFFVSNGRVLDPVPNLGEGNFTAEDRYFGRTIAFRIDRFVIAFRGFAESQALLDLAIATDQRILASIRTQLQEEESQATSMANPPAGALPEAAEPNSTTSTQ